MADLTVQQLADVVTGHLSFGSMPPIGGLDLPVGRVVADSRRAAAGDLFWGLPGTRHDGSHFAEEALLRGAHGTVVAGRHIEPWAGRFSLRVDDACDALLQAGRWARSTFPGPVIALPADADTAAVRTMLPDLLQPGATAASNISAPHSVMQAALAMLNWDENEKCAIVEIGGDDPSKIDAISHLCRPHITAISCLQNSRHKQSSHLTAFAKVSTRLLRSLPSDGVAVLHGDDPWLRRAADACSATTVWVGQQPDCDIVAENVHCHDGSLAFELDGSHFEVPNCGPDYFETAILSYALGKMLGLPLSQSQLALQTQRPTPAASPATYKSRKVPSSAPALREVGATLPPGLERHAC